MRHIYITFVLIAGLLIADNGFAQETGESLRDRLAKRQEAQKKQNQGSVIPRLSTRAEMKNQNQSIDYANVSWVREVYRVLDVSKGSNAALNNPTYPVNGRMSLFTMIFRLMAQGDLIAYEYPLDGTEIFSDQFIMDFEKDVLDRLNIPHEKSGDFFTFNEMDVPSGDVYGFYIKEAWYFDKTNSVMGREVVAICPVINRVMIEDDGEMNLDLMPSSRVPLFWIPYENIRPYAARMPIMASNYNNVMNKTIDDYFTMNLYDGEIYKTTNMENKILLQQYETEEEVELARKKIESELRSFNDSLWVANDSIDFTGNKKMKKQKKSKSKAPKASKTQNSSSGGAKYSARDRR